MHVVTLQREGSGRWQQSTNHTRLHPWRYKEVVKALEAAEFRNITCYGDMTGASFDVEASPNLVVLAQR
jgi:hypothetical protein